MDPLFFTMSGGKATYNRAPTADELERFFQMRMAGLALHSGQATEVPALVSGIVVGFEMAKAVAKENEQNKAELDRVRQVFDGEQKWEKIAHDYEDNVLRVGKPPNKWGGRGPIGSESG